MPFIHKDGKHVPPFKTKGNEMTANIEKQPAVRRNIWRIIGWGGAVGLILTPLVAMQFTREVNWTGGDFILAAVIFSIVGGLIELAVRRSSNWYFRFGAIFAVLAGFIVVWSNLAVGMIGNEDNPVNLLFLGVLFVAIIGSILARFRSALLSYTMLAAGAAQASIAVFAGILGTDMRGGIFTLILAGFWIISSALFYAASSRDRTGLD